MTPPGVTLPGLTLPRRTLARLSRGLAAGALAAALLVPAAAQAKEATVVLKVAGWHCAGCASATEAKLRKLKGVQKADADKATDQVTVVYDDAAVGPGEFEKTIEGLHYKVVK
jgi:copper chaperone CopZ